MDGTPRGPVLPFYNAPMEQVFWLGFWVGLAAGVAALLAANLLASALFSVLRRALFLYRYRPRPFRFPSGLTVWVHPKKGS